MLDDADLSAIERRSTAVASVRQVVNAVWALSRAQVPVIDQAAAEVSTYIDWVEAIVMRLAGRPESPSGSALSVVFGPERPFAGALHRQVTAQIPTEGQLGLVGGRLAEQAMQVPSVASRVVFSLPGPASAAEAPAVARTVAGAVLECAAGQDVHVHYPRGGSELHSVVLLGGSRTRTNYPPSTLSPYEVVLQHAVFEAVTGRLSVAAVESLRTEVRARVAAAEQARRACDGHIAALEQSWRAARQEQITTELLEISAGAQASGPRREVVKNSA